MKFGPVVVERAEGAILAHSVSEGEVRFKKGRLLGADDIAALVQAGVREVIIARPDRGDVSEDEAAARIAQAFVAPNIVVKPAATGRVNLHAAAGGVFTVDKDLIDAINRIDPAITVATLANHTPVDMQRMVATVKIIPFAVAEELVEKVVALCAGRTIFEVHPWKPVRVALIQSTLPGVKPSVLDKTARVTAYRLSRSGSLLGREVRPAHDTHALAGAINATIGSHDMAIVFGASAMSDPDDAVPAAIRRAGGRVERAGMPVDPGNLIVLGEVAGKPVLGAPGCARSPKENGFDWVLDRLIAGVPVDGEDIAGMGVGGLLMEIATRPLPREQATRSKTGGVHAIVLAAGRSSRMGGPNKLLALFDGEPLVRRVAERTLAAKADGVTVVTGHQSDRVGAALSGLSVKAVHNPDFAEGLSASLKSGIAAVPPDAAGALVVLGDMPAVSSADLDRLVEAFRAAGGRQVVRAACNGKRGNPVLLPRSLFAAVAALEGDTGARHIIEAEGVEVIDIEIGEGAFVDVDTREAMAGAGGVLQE